MHTTPRSHSTFLFFAVILLLGQASCSKSQSLDEGLQVMCTAPMKSPRDITDRSNDILRVSKWIDANVTNKGARQVHDNLAGADPAKRVTMMQEAAASAKISECAYVDWLRSNLTYEESVEK